ncbi:hypothetical protein HMPREF0860_2611 [Treponema socranskii subsp. socranskii VPI DR56BR1116 = ATCC 35536]|uniref:Uncharacterized protein n=1 Tax=Treponema socranskii subsp. socranskii VPI DR56BR1116 = ATCC 35536 TaxID=1125725 RepID=U1FJP4_TRESO|nr:hypothetical protein HMPREF1325_1192 [Treponema socranskii subsp. socranskii VPI DR56BR1116 = ATCC 35536]ERK04175.1 hypothetical protein HMPREF0860_2611 [Treponema socranskii subsp. socranskii VPI DR56BR1116 = ATCC 35536]
MSYLYTVRYIMYRSVYYLSRGERQRVIAQATGLTEAEIEQL